MNESKTIKVQLADGAIKNCAVGISQSFPWKLTFSGMDLAKHDFSGEDLFDALIALRLELERGGHQLLCAGARPDVFPSGMSREMGRACKAYINRLGAGALKTDIVDIFDYAGTELVGSVAQQNAFHQRWIESLRSLSQ